MERGVDEEGAVTEGRIGEVGNRTRMRVTTKHTRQMGGTKERRWDLDENEARLLVKEAQEDVDGRTRGDRAVTRVRTIDVIVMVVTKETSIEVIGGVEEEEELGGMDTVVMDEEGDGVEEVESIVVEEEVMRTGHVAQETGTQMLLEKQHLMPGLRESHRL